MNGQEFPHGGFLDETLFELSDEGFSGVFAETIPVHFWDFQVIGLKKGQIGDYGAIRD